jgi:CDGSH-type Zn-finger protein
MNNKGVTFIDPNKKIATELIKSPAGVKSLTASLSDLNRPKCGCGKSKTGYCDGSHSLPTK